MKPDNGSTIFSESSIGKAFKMNKLNIPTPEKIINTNIEMPFYFVGDEALQKNLMCPFPRRQLDLPKRIFNYRLSRARRTVECSFGILVKKFAQFQKSMETGLEITEIIIKSACVLHNFIRKEPNEAGRMLEKLFLENDQESHELHSIVPTNAHRSTLEAMRIREKLMNYFISTAGSVSWQYNKLV